MQYVFSNHTLRIYGTISAPSDANRRFYLYLNKQNGVFDTQKINTCTVKFTENSIFKSIVFGSTSAPTYYYQSRSKNTYTDVFKVGTNRPVIFVSVDESNYVDITIEDIAVYEGAYTNPPFTKSIVELHNRNSLQVPVSGELSYVQLDYVSNVKYVVPLFALKKNMNAGGWARGYLYAPTSGRGINREYNCEFYMRCGYSSGDHYNYVFLRNNCKSYTFTSKLVPVTFDYGLLPDHICYGIAKMDTNNQDMSIFGCYTTMVSSDNSDGIPFIFPKQLIKYANANGTAIYNATINSTITQLNYQYKCIEEL